MRFGLLLLAAGSAACFTDPPAPQRIPSESGGSTGDSQETDSSSGENPSATTTSESSSSGEPEFGCAQAFDAKSCAEASDPALEQCSWYPTINHDPFTCEPWATDNGACVIEQGLDGCAGSDPTCEDGTSWYYRVTDGFVELVDATNLCYGLSEFTPCPWSPSDPGETDSTSVGSSTSVGTGASTDGGSGSTGGLETGASASSVGDGGTSGGTSGGTTGDGWSLQEEIEFVCACACDA